MTAGCLMVLAATVGLAVSASAQERLPWETQRAAPRAEDPYAPSTRPQVEQPPYEPQPRYEASPYGAPRAGQRDRGEDGADRERAGEPRRGDGYGYGAPYAPPRPQDRVGEPYEQDYGGGPRRGDGIATYSEGEIVAAGHSFFGSLSRGLAQAVESLFKKAGRPNGYILGEDAGGAFIAGLRYGEGVLYTKNAGDHRVYWQGPSLGYDFGGEGSKVMVLVYNLRDPSDIYERFGGVQGSAYVVGGLSVQLQKRGDVTLAPIRAGVGLRLGANVGYLKYTRRPTWNPF